MNTNKKRNRCNDGNSTKNDTIDSHVRRYLLYNQIAAISFKALAAILAIAFPIIILTADLLNPDFGINAEYVTLYVAGIVGMVLVLYGFERKGIDNGR